MKKKVLSIIGFIGIIALGMIIFNKKDNEYDKYLFSGLEPKAKYKEYKIYDLVEQKHLACAEAVEILDSDKNYDYYFECLKSNNIYLVSDEEILKVKEAYNRKIITKEKLYELGIVKRMSR